MVLDTGVPAVGDDRWDLEFTLNGKPVSAAVDPSLTLLDALRMTFGLTGTKGACTEGECGSCTVMLDGVPVCACLMLAPQAHGRDVLTIEGLADSDGTLHVLQRKFVEMAAVQCGYCTPGLIMAAKDILDRMPGCGEEVFAKALEGNICRCTGYSKIFEAVREAYRETHGEEVEPAAVAADFATPRPV